ncbi:hypothetical protein SODALDRAFT_375314 [Sodiomyces alkalinus F11]|uniref:Uncharacterized protein n=1 Tax=Sodiomyces alkalinus (strain CBS 110278 / VKM F-3762 / F11) TaxID=1314773 RepID=A0A3N2Q8P1_SODAK|nr:hypothetical protein SODALDRAFT_375314 [Sodiomyces alkalinus F11]ROT43096.1 hypothetical protein SODALDRAFT_375314 [Sodiomyces alkalinus F11]
MNIAPFKGLPLAPANVEMSHFDAYIKETRDILQAQHPCQIVTPDMLAAAIQTRARAELAQIREREKARQQATEEDLQMAGIVNDEEVINESLKHGVEAQDWHEAEAHDVSEQERVKRIKLENPVFTLQDDMGGMAMSFNLIDKLSENVELAVNLGLHLDPADVVHLFSVSKRFNRTISGNMTSSIRTWVREHAGESSEIFSFKLYRHLCIRDPAGRTNAFAAEHPDPVDPDQQAIRHVPSLRWYHMVVLRERCVDDIVDALERSGYYLPRGMEKTLKKMWLLMDVATTKGRRDMIGNTALWSKTDLYHAQLFIVKLNMFFSDPIFLPRDGNSLPRLLLGQRGLYRLWQALTDRAWTKPREVTELKVRYDYIPTYPQFRRALFGETVFGVHPYEVGVVHLEGWGRGSGHLMRPDELIVEEANRRVFTVDKHIIYMILWGPVEKGPFRKRARSESESDSDSSPVTTIPSAAAAAAVVDASTGIINHAVSEELVISSDDEADSECEDGYYYDDDEDDDDLLTEEEKIPNWTDLLPFEKSIIMLENVDPVNAERQFLFQRQADLQASSAGFGTNRRGEGDGEDDGTNEEGGEGGEGGEEEEEEEEDGLDFSALPNPDDRDPRRVDILSAPVHRAAVPGDAPVTAAIQVALDAAARTAAPDAGTDEDVRDHVTRMFFGPVGTPDEPDLLARADRAWDDYEAEDLDPDWRAYVEEINAPDDEDFDDFDNVLFYHRGDGYGSEYDG